MNQDLLHRLRSLSSDDSCFGELEHLLVSNSNLPGPRGNLELAGAFADSFEAFALNEARWQLLERWLRLSADEAPTGDPREFLPFCALQALGACYRDAGVAGRERIVRTLQASAGDSRWRTREAVAMAFQRIAERDFGAVREIFSAWIGRASYLDQRAIIAALAHPPVLKRADNAAFCLQVSERILSNVLSSDQRARKTEQFRVLRQGLEYAISVFVAYLPEEGFAFLERWARQGDADVKRIVMSNAGKTRLKKCFPAEVGRLLAVL